MIFKWSLLYLVAIFPKITRRSIVNNIIFACQKKKVINNKLKTIILVNLQQMNKGFKVTLNRGKVCRRGRLYLTLVCHERSRVNELFDIPQVLLRWVLYKSMDFRLSSICRKKEKRCIPTNENVARFSKKLFLFPFLLTSTR